MARFKQGNTFSTGRKKDSRNKLTNDVRAAFHKAYANMGGFDENGKLIETGDEVFLAWARENQTEFYRLFAKILPKTVELPDDFLDELVLEEEQVRLIDAPAKGISTKTNKSL